MDVPGELTSNEVCQYFEALPPERRALVWIRCERILGQPFAELEPDDPYGDEIFVSVVKTMFIQDTLERLVELGALEAELGPDGALSYRTPN